MKIRFAHGGQTAWTAWLPDAVLTYPIGYLKHATLCYQIQPGDRMFWTLGTHAHFSLGMVGAPVGLGAWIESTTGSIWDFASLEVYEDQDGPATAVCDALLAVAEKLARGAGMPLQACDEGPGHIHLSGTVLSSGISRGEPKTIPPGCPFFELSVAGLVRPVLICPGHGPDNCWRPVSKTDRAVGEDAGYAELLEHTRKRLEAVRQVLEAGMDAHQVTVKGHWSLVYPKDDPWDQPSVPPPLDPQIMRALSGSSGGDPSRPISRRWVAMDPRIVFWCNEAWSGSKTAPRSSSQTSE